MHKIWWCEVLRRDFYGNVFEKNSEFRDKNRNMAENFDSLSEIGRKTSGKQEFSFKAVSKSNCINCVMLKGLKVMFEKLVSK